MRIIAGIFGIRRLASVQEGIRPSSDRLRETLFDILGNSVSGSNWLDPFAGSGAVGIEALSRGARFVVFNDKSLAATQLIRKNLEICKVQAGYEIHQVDVFRLLKDNRMPPLDFVFLDPHYSFPRLKKLLTAVSRIGSLQLSTSVVLELSRKTKTDFLENNWIVSRQLVTGDSQLVFLEAGFEQRIK